MNLYDKNQVTQDQLRTTGLYNPYPGTENPGRYQDLARQLSPEQIQKMIDMKAGYGSSSDKDRFPTYGDQPPAGVGRVYPAVMPKPGMKYVYDQKTGDRIEVPIRDVGDQYLRKQPNTPVLSPEEEQKIIDAKIRATEELRRRKQPIDPDTQPINAPPMAEVPVIPQPPQKPGYPKPGYPMPQPKPRPDYPTIYPIPQPKPGYPMPKPGYPNPGVKPIYPVKPIKPIYRTLMNTQKNNFKSSGSRLY